LRLPARRSAGTAPVIAGADRSGMRGRHGSAALTLPCCAALDRRREPMTTVKTCLEQKPIRIIAVRPDDWVATALQAMRDNRVRAILVLDGDRLCGIVTQGDCAIKVLLPGRDAKATRVRDVMTADPMTVKPADPLEACMGLMAERGFRHLPVLDQGRVVGVISIGDVVKDMVRRMSEQIGFLETYIRGHGA
jgi:CBS domain-containing protein